MSPQLLDRSSDLRKLLDEGYEVSVSGAHLVVDHVPYLAGSGAVQYGRLISTLALAGDITTTPDTHVVFFDGDYPCHKPGVPIVEIRHQSQDIQLGNGLRARHSFSSKPAGGYVDYYEKMSTYASILAAPAQAVVPTATARTYVRPPSAAHDSPFRFQDSASARARIAPIAEKLSALRIAIVGVGGTGSYVLDLIAKTPVREIHLFDGDTFHQHNAFRSPGAASLEELRKLEKKVDRCERIYSQMRTGLFAHAWPATSADAALLSEMDFVFVCVDSPRARRELFEVLERAGKHFIDVGLGVSAVETQLLGILRVTLSTPDKRNHVAHRVALSDAPDEGLYATNIQVAELNMLNAALAVLQWKKLCGFYQDLNRNHSWTYTINVGMLLGEDP